MSLAARTLTSDRRRRLRRPPGEPAAPQFYVQPVGSAPAEGGPVACDLLHAEPQTGADLRGSTELVRFAFEGGDAAGVFDALIEALPLAPSGVDATTFAPQLYLDELIDGALHVKVAGERVAPNKVVLRRILEAPPAKAEDCAARQLVLAELVASATLRDDLGKLYVALRRLRAALETTAAAEPNLVRRKIGVLVALRAAVDAMADGFDTRSVLSRLRDKARALRDDPAWQRLVRIVDLEGNLATVDVRLRLGSDGALRGFEVLAVRDHAEDPLPGPFVRLLQRLWSFVRGYRYGENEVVLRLLEELFAPFADVVVELLASTGAVELYLAALGFRELAEANGLAVCLPELGEPPAAGATTERVLEGLFNPLLFLQGVTPVACDLPALRHDALVVVTGPNSGGKTRLLQSLALTQLLAQVGIFVPASRARLVRAPGLFLSLVTEGDAGQVEGRLGTELLRIRALFEQLEAGSFAVLDELCSGTNPMEGESIFEMVVSLLPRLRPQVFVSTHFLGLAARLERDRPVDSLAFLQAELDAAERPTYRFVPGVARTSLAHKVAERLGVTREELEKLVAGKAR